jgi:ribonuclease HII
MATSAKKTGRRKKRTAARLFRFDRQFGSRFVAGVDEAGRGSLAGPLVAGGVLIDLERIGTRERRALAHLDDSKQKSPEEREALYPAVIRAAVCVSVAVRSVRAIDSNGLHVSNIAALADCMRGVATDLDDVTRLVDGFKLHACELEHRNVIDGDARSAAIAAASVIAKVTRDRYMHRVASVYPRWNFDGNVGYSTPDHREAIREHGICPLHRRSFASIAYTQLELGDDDAGLEGIDELGLDAESERIADVIDIRTAMPVEADADDVKPIARDA